MGCFQSHAEDGTSFDGQDYTFGMETATSSNSSMHLVFLVSGSDFSLGLGDEGRIVETVEL